MRIPSSYNLRVIQADGEAGLEMQYWYNDSSVIYISDMMNNLNYENLRNKDGAYSKDFIAFASNDTLTLEGQDSKGLYWKNKRIKNVCIGYANTPISKKVMFDKALESIRSIK